MEEFRVTGFLAAWLFIIIEGTFWMLLAYALCKMFNKSSGLVKSWIVRVAFIKFWITAVAFSLASIWLNQAMPDLSEIAEWVVAVSPLLQLMFAIGAVGLVSLAIKTFSLHLRIKRLASLATHLEEITGLDPYVRLAQPFECWHVPIVLVTSDRSCPALVGVWNQAIVIPSHYVASGLSERCLTILSHELAHVKRRDSLWSYTVLSGVAVMPWNPLVHMLAKEYETAVESACDALVLSRSQVAKSEYASALIDEASKSPRLSRIEGLAFGSPSFKGLERRLNQISEWTGRPQTYGKQFAVLAALAALVPSTAPSVASNKAKEARRISIGVPMFDVVWVDSDPGLGEARAWEVNSKGEMAVSVNWRKPFVWSKERGLMPLTTDQFDSQVNCINQSGILGGGDHGRMGIFNAPKEYDALKSLIGHVWDISDSGFAVGRLDEGAPTAFRFHPQEGLIKVPAPQVYGESTAGGVNNKGHVVGFVSPNHFMLGPEFGYFWDGKGKPVTLPPPSGYPHSDANSINDGGLIVGGAKSASILTVLPVAWPKPDEPIIMERLPLTPNGAARQVNNSGWSVGRAWSTNEFDTTAVIWSPDYRITDLNDCVTLPPGWKIFEAFGISDNMYIAASARKGSVQKAVLLRPRADR